MSTKEELPEWAKDRMEAEEQMGAMQSSATFAEGFFGLLYIAFRIGFFVGFCVLVVLVGMCAIGAVS